MTTPVSTRLFGAALTTFMIIAGVYVLWVAQSFFIPLLLALLLTLLIISAAEAFSSIPIGPWRLPRPIGFLLTFVVIVLLLNTLIKLLQNELSTLVEVAPLYQERFTNLFNSWIDYLQIEPPSFEGTLGQVSVGNLVKIGLQTLSEIAGYIGIVGLYVIFMILEYSFFPTKLRAALGTDQRTRSVEKMLTKAAKRVQGYLLIKTGLSALTAAVSYVILMWVGVHFAGLWAALIFFLNFIPNIGSIVATTFPCLVALVQFDSFTPFLQVAIGLTALEVAIGNLLEPRVMGQAFNLSGLVIVLSLTFWGTIWGIVGMFLSVPLMVISTILLANFKHTRPVAIMLSRDGDI